MVKTLSPFLEDFDQSGLVRGLVCSISAGTN